MYQRILVIGETVVNMNRNLGFERTEQLIFCPLCKQLVLAVKVEGMCGSYERCSNCLIGFETEAWIHAYRMILSKPSQANLRDGGP